jgi:hypothetical protein
VLQEGDFRVEVLAAAIAWKLLNYRRQWVVLMGRAHDPGMMTGKSGFASEW